MDDDCDGSTDESSAVDASTWYADLDEDGYGNPDSSIVSCAEPEGYTLDDNDCDDSLSDVSPGADEYCNGVDDDCDGSRDESSAVDASTWYADADSDGFGDSATSDIDCDQPSG